jgi:hypothetical protein
VLWLFELNQTLYWVALATWFGAALFIAIAAPIILRTVRELDPTLPGVLSVNLDTQHATLMSGTIVSQIMRVVTRIALGCAVAILIGLIGQALIIQRRARGGSSSSSARDYSPRRRACCCTTGGWCARGSSSIDSSTLTRPTTPTWRTWRREQFERFARESVNVLFFQTLLLLGMIVASVNISPPLMFGD